MKAKLDDNLQCCKHWHPLPTCLPVEIRKVILSFAFDPLKDPWQCKKILILTMTLPETQIWLLQGVGCKREFCLPWLARWEKELVGFTLFDTFEEEGKSLSFTYERLRAEHADLLRTHHEHFERKCNTLICL